MKINLKKISELSGFSLATVSNALNNKSGVNRETAEQILKIAREHGAGVRRTLSPSVLQVSLHCRCRAGCIQALYAIGKLLTPLAHS